MAMMLIVKNVSNAVLFKCFGGCDPRAMFEELRARGLWDENAPLAPDQQHPEKPMAAAPAQADVAALAFCRASWEAAPGRHHDRTVIAGSRVSGGGLLDWWRRKRKDSGALAAA